MDDEPTPDNLAPPDQLQMAMERTFLAYERTLMAWIRTSVSLIAFGFTLYRFFYFLREQQPDKHAEHPLGARTFGLIMMGIGVVALALAAWQHREQMNRMRGQFAEVPFSPTLILAGLIAGLGLLGFTAAILGQ